MTRRILLVLSAAVAVTAFTARAATPSGDPTRGARLFRACAACHSLAPDRNMTGPSLAGVWGRKAGSLKSFERYSSALKASNVVWNEAALDQWLKSPSQFIPNNHMPFDGIPDARQRADLIAFLKEASSGHMPAAGQGSARGGMMGGMMGGMSPQFQDLKKLGPDRQVEAIQYCHNTYRVTMADGKTADFWEANLRFKTDSSDTGPPSGKPVIMPAGMMGDRASVFFAAPEEISAFIKDRC